MLESEHPRIRDAGTSQASVCSLCPPPHTHLQEMCSLLAPGSLKKDSRDLQAWLLLPGPPSDSSLLLPPTEMEGWAGEWRD